MGLEGECIPCVWRQLSGLVFILIISEICSGRYALLVEVIWGRLCAQFFIAVGYFAGGCMTFVNLFNCIKGKDK